MRTDLQIAVWRKEPELHADFARSLEIYYRRIPAAGEPWFESDIDILLRRAAAQDELGWLAVIRRGTIFADQARVLPRIEVEIAASRVHAAATGDEDLLLINLANYRRMNRPPFREITLFAPTSCLGDHKVSIGAGSGTLNRNLEQLYRMEDLANPSQRAILGFMLNRKLGLQPEVIPDLNLVDHMGVIFLFNTEELPSVRPHRQAPLDIYFGPCAGFLETAALFVHGFHAKTRVVLFDINRHAIAFKRRILREFDGRLAALPEYFARLVAESPADLSFWTGDPARELAKIRGVFGSDENFARTWAQVRRLDMEFVHCNLLADFDRLLARHRPDESGLIAISDIFTGQNELTYGRTAVCRHHAAFVENCRRRPGLAVSGTDVDSRTVTHV